MVIISTINFHFFSKYCDETTSSAYGIAVSFFNILGLPVVTSLTNALNIASSQGFGAEKLKVSQLYFQTALMLQFVTLIFVLAGMGFLVQYTNFSPFPDEIATEKFRTMILFVFSERVIFMFFYNVQTLLFSFKKFREISMIVCFSLFVHWISISNMAAWWGRNGIFASITLNSVLNLTILVSFIKIFKPLPEGMTLNLLPGISSLFDWKRVKKILQFSQSIYFQVLSDCLSFNALIIFTGAYGEQYVMANVIFVNLYQYSFRYCVCLGNTVNTELGIRFGKKDDIGARQVFFHGFKIIFFMTYLIMAAFMLFQEQFISIFTKSLESRQAIDGVWFFILLVAIPSDAIQNYFMTVINSLEEKQFVKKTTQIGFYCITIPSAYMLGTVFQLQLLGIWLGMTLGNTFMMIRTMQKSFEIDFNTQMVLINHRLRREQEIVSVQKAIPLQSIRQASANSGYSTDLI